MSRGLQIERVHYLVQGQVLMHSSSPDGRETAFNIVRRGELVGLTGIASNNFASYDATTISPCEFLTVERNLFQRLVLENPAAMQEAIDRLVAFIRHATGLAESLASQSLKARLARWILTRLEDDGVALEPGAVLPIDFSQRLIAALAGVSRETVNRQLKYWAEDGIISFSGRTLRILRPKQLLFIAGYNNDRQDG